MEKLGALLNGIVCITGKGGTKAGFHLLDGRPIFSSSNQGLGRSVKGKNRDMQNAGVIQIDRKNRVVAFLPIGEVGFMVNVNFNAVVKTVPMPGKGIDEKVRTLVMSDRVFFFKNGEKVVLELGRAVGKVEGDNGFVHGERFFCRNVSS